MSSTYARFAAVIAVIALLSAGCAHVVKRPAPSFKAQVVSGDTRPAVSLEDFRGRPLVLNIGAIWCPHCLHELPAFTAAYEKYKADVTVLVVFIKSEREAIEEVQKDKDLPFIVATDPSSEIGRAYGIKGIPVTLFIDSNGVITDEYLGGLSESMLFDRIEALIKMNANPADR